MFSLIFSFCLLLPFVVGIDVGEKLFPDGVKVKKSSLKYYIELFNEKDNVQPQLDLNDLTIGLKIHEVWNNSAVENWEFYKKSFENLKKALPNLKILRATGGHSYYPKNGTLRQIRCDLLLVHNALDAITKQMKNWPLTAGDQPADGINYTLYHFIADELFILPEYREILVEIFGRDRVANIKDRDLKDYTLSYSLNDIPVNIIVEVFTDLDAVREHTNLEFGRVDYKSSAWEIARLDLAKSKKDA